MTPQEVAATLGITRRTVYQMTKDGRLPYVRIGRLVRIPADAIPTPTFASPGEVPAAQPRPVTGRFSRRVREGEVV